MVISWPGWMLCSLFSLVEGLCGEARCTGKRPGKKHWRVNMVDPPLGMHKIGEDSCIQRVLYFLEQIAEKCSR